MKLADYQSRESLSLRGLAAKLGLKETTLHGYLDGRRRPSAEAAARIIEATDGAVTLEDLRPDLASAFASRLPSGIAA